MFLFLFLCLRFDFMAHHMVWIPKISSYVQIIYYYYYWRRMNYFGEISIFYCWNICMYLSNKWIGRVPTLLGNNRKKKTCKHVAIKWIKLYDAKSSCEHRTSVGLFVGSFWILFFLDSLLFTKFILLSVQYKCKAINFNWAVAKASGFLLFFSFEFFLLRPEEF